MQKLCPNCLYIGEGVHKFGDGCNIPVSGLLIGAGFIMVPVGFAFFIFGIAAPLALIYLGVLKIVHCWTSGNQCPICENERMVLLDSKAAEAIISAHNLDIDKAIEKSQGEIDSSGPKKMFCSNCQHTTKSSGRKVFDLVAGIVLILLAIITTPNVLEWNTLSSPIWSVTLLGPIIWLLFGVYCIVSYFRKSGTCPKCKSNSFVEQTPHKS